MDERKTHTQLCVLNPKIYWDGCNKSFITFMTATYRYAYGCLPHHLLNIKLSVIYVIYVKIHPVGFVTEIRNCARYRK